MAPFNLLVVRHLDMTDVTFKAILKDMAGCIVRTLVRTYIIVHAVTTIMFNLS